MRAAHDQFFADYNLQSHFAHRKRRDGWRTPSEVLGLIHGVWCDDAEPDRLFRIRSARVFDRGGYLRYKRWRIYGERGLAGERGAVWLFGEVLTVAYEAQNERGCHEGQGNLDKVPFFILAAALRFIGSPLPGASSAHHTLFTPENADTGSARHFALMASAASETGNALIAPSASLSEGFRPLRGPPRHDALPLVTPSLTLGLLCTHG